MLNQLSQFYDYVKELLGSDSESPSNTSFTSRKRSISREFENLDDDDDCRIFTEPSRKKYKFEGIMESSRKSQSGKYKKRNGSFSCLNPFATSRKQSTLDLELDSKGSFSGNSYIPSGSLTRDGLRSASKNVSLIDPSFRFNSSLKSSASKIVLQAASSRRKDKIGSSFPSLGLSPRSRIIRNRSPSFYTKMIDRRSQKLVPSPIHNRPSLHRSDSIRLDEKHQYGILLKQYANLTDGPAKATSLGFNSLISYRAVRDGAMRITRHHGKVMQAETEKANASKQKSPPSSLSSRIGSPMRFFDSAVSSTPKEVNVSLPNKKEKDMSKGSDDLVIVKEVITPREIPTNNLEKELLKSPIYKFDWLCQRRKHYSELGNTANELVAEAEEAKKGMEIQRKKSTEAMINKLEHRIKLLDFKYPQKIIEAKKDELAPLTPEMEAMVDNALRRGPATQIVADKFNLSITRRDIHTLTGLNWLNDEVINFFMNLLVERGKNDNMPSVYTFNTFFYPKLIKTGYQSIKRWTKKVDIFSHDLLLIPIHLGMHWCMATIDLRKKTVNYYDSMLGNNNKCLSELFNYLESEHQDKKKTSFDSESWKTQNMKDIPQQMNGSDCGMFACRFAEVLSRDDEIEFDQENMPYFRRRMIYEIIKMQLM